MVDRVVEFNPDVIGIGSFTVSFETTKRLAAELKSVLPKVPIVLGSYHVTLVPEDAMADENFDVGVLGEGEHTMLELVEHYRSGTRWKILPVSSTATKMERFTLRSHGRNLRRWMSCRSRRGICYRRTSTGPYL